MSEDVYILPLAVRERDYCMIVGVLNEGARFSAQLARMQNQRHLVDILIADGNSNDGATLPEMLAGKAHALIIDKRGKGLSGQYQSAIGYALEQGYQGIMMIDGNGKDGVEAAGRMAEQLAAGVDLVQGSRFLPGGEHTHTPFIRHIAIRWIFNPLMWLVTGYYYSDGINGFKSVSRRLLEHPGIQPLREEFHFYSLQYYFNYRAPKLGLRVQEVAVSRNYPASGAIPTKIRGPAAYFKILAELIKVCIGHYNPKA